MQSSVQKLILLISNDKIEKAKCRKDILTASVILKNNH